MHSIECDIAIIGGGTGGAAAARSAQAAGLRVVLTETTDWIGGQFTSQGVSALDEHPHIEQFGGTASYIALRERIRQHYKDTYNLPDTPELNPGNAWVSRLSFDPRVGHACLLADPAYQQITTLLNTEPVSAEVEGHTVKSVTVRHTLSAEETRIHARYFLDATDLGDLLPLTGTAYITGAESQADTGEPDAPAEACPGEIQSFTVCFAVEYRPGEDHTLPKPEGYEHFRDHQPYSLILHDKQRNELYFDMFRVSEQGKLPFWTYRRIHDGSLLDGNDISLINWHGNDYYGGSVVDVSPAEKARSIDEARRLALGFLYWLQTECSRDDGGYGYPEFMLRPDVMDTEDGLSKQPYLREGRRLIAHKRIVTQDIAAEANPGTRAKNQSDSLGIGWYAIDLHPCVGNPTIAMYAPTRPFQIPIGALVPQQTNNLIAAGKNIGTTHLTNGAYRLHPIEWNIGESAGLLAAFCIQNDCTPRDVAADAWLTWRFQYQLVTAGIPLFWTLDIPPAHDLFVPSQLLLVRDVLRPGSTRWNSLKIQPDRPLGDDFSLYKLQAVAAQLGVDPGIIHPDISWRDLCNRIQPALEHTLSHSD